MLHVAIRPTNFTVAAPAGKLAAAVNRCRHPARSNQVTKFRSSLAFALVLASPGIAFAQSSDAAAYCQALGAKYNAMQSEHAQTVSESVAIARCETDTAEGTPVVRNY